MSTATQPRQVIVARLAQVREELAPYQELADEERRLVAALAALDGEHTFMPADTSPAANRARRGDRTQKEMVLHLIREQPGIRTRDIRELTNFGPSLNTLLSRLKAAEDIVKVGDGWDLSR